MRPGSPRPHFFNKFSELFAFPEAPSREGLKCIVSGVLTRLIVALELPLSASKGPLNRGDVVLGIVGFGTNRDAKSRQLAKPRREAFRSDY